MPTSNLTIETGKLMATVANLQNELTGIKKEIRALNTHVMGVHDELVSFIGNVQTKTNCERIHQSLKSDYVQRAELAPFKTILGAISATTVAAISVALLNLILK
ncbi:MAG: hypothetical protein II938_04780 [Alphaproteobacteria bacterium]|nr:hypothetical protein [Alphaproteobacteria bacterium]